MIGLLNIGSLLLGILAWILPAVSLMRSNKLEHKKWAIYSMMSLGACAISVSFQIFNSYHRVKIEDWFALIDTAGAVAFAAAVLLVVTVILNGLTLYVYRQVPVR